MRLRADGDGFRLGRLRAPDILAVRICQPGLQRFGYFASRRIPLIRDFLQAGEADPLQGEWDLLRSSRGGCTGSDETTRVRTAVSESPWTGGLPVKRA